MKNTFTVDLRDFSKANLIRCEESFRFLDEWSPTDWATALAGEVGEACNLIAKKRRGDDIRIEDIADELSDALTYLDLLAQRLGIDLTEAMARKFNIVSERVDSSIRLNAETGGAE